MAGFLACGSSRPFPSQVTPVDMNGCSPFTVAGAATECADHFRPAVLYSLLSLLSDTIESDINHLIDKLQ